MANERVTVILSVQEEYEGFTFNVTKKNGNSDTDNLVSFHVNQEQAIDISDYISESQMVKVKKREEEEPYGIFYQGDMD